MKSIKYIFGGLALTLLLSGCSSSSETVYKENGKAFTTSDLVKATQDEFGSNVFQQALAYRLILDAYPVTDKEVEKSYEEEAATYESIKEFEQALTDYGTTPAIYKKDIRNRISYDKAYSELNHVNEKDIKARYQEVKEVTKATFVVINSTDKAVIKKYDKILEKEFKKGTDYAGFLKKFSDDDVIVVSSSDLIKGQTDDALAAVLDLENGEYKRMREDDGVAYIKKTGTYEGQYDEMKENIKTELEKDGKYQTLSSIYKKIAKDRGIEFTDAYKTFGDITTLVEELESTNK